MSTTIPYLSFDQVNTVAAAIRQKLDIKDDTLVDITKLALDLGCAVFEVDFVDDDVSGSVEFVDGKNIINISKDDGEKRKRFTIAHELAHVILHRNPGQTLVDYRQPYEYYIDKIDIRKEVQANMLAAALLMPKDTFKKTWTEFEDVEKTAEFFRVSRKAVSIRLETLDLLD